MKDGRRADLARIHILAKTIFGGDQEAYRDCLFAVASVRSASALGHEQRKRVLAHFVNLERRQRGEQARPDTGVPRNVAPDRARLMRKIDWQLAGLGKTRDYLEASMLRRLTGVDRLEFATPDKLSKVVAALAMHMKRQREAAQP